MFYSRLDNGKFFHYLFRFFGVSRGADVKVVGFFAEKNIAHAAADAICLFACVVHHFYDFFGFFVHLHSSFTSSSVVKASSVVAFANFFIQCFSPEYLLLLLALSTMYFTLRISPTIMSIFFALVTAV